MLRYRLTSLAVVFVLLSLMIAPAFASAKTYTGIIVRDKIIFREEASTSSNILTRFMKGDKVQITGISGNFYSVTFKKIKGFVMRKFVEVQAADQRALERQNASAKTKSTAAAVTPRPTATKAPADAAMKGITKISQIKVFTAPLGSRVPASYPAMFARLVPSFSANSSLRKIRSRFA